MNERRAGLEKVNARVEPAKDGRRPPLTLEVSNKRTGSGRRGSGVDMRAKEKRVNMGSPTGREARSQPAIRSGSGRAAPGGGEVRSSDEASNDRGAKGP
jgi:hypothetical protein